MGLFILNGHNVGQLPRLNLGHNLLENLLHVFGYNCLFLTGRPEIGRKGLKKVLSNLSLIAKTFQKIY